MKANLILVVLAFAVAALAASPSGQTAVEQPTKVEQLRQQLLEERAEVLAQIFEKRAELVRLSANQEPDVEKVRALVKEIAELRDKQQKKCVEYRATMAALGRPAVGPDLRGSAGRIGLGPGARYNPRWGQARPCCRRAWGGPRRVHPGFSPGRPPVTPWATRTYARGQGLGFGPGRPPVTPWATRTYGRGQGPGFGPGAREPRFGPPRGQRMGGRGARPWGPGPRYTDTDNDGVCDYWEGRGNPPPPPVEPPADAGDQPTESR